RPVPVPHRQRLHHHARAWPPTADREHGQRRLPPGGARRGGCRSERPLALTRDPGWDAELARGMRPAPLLQSWAWGEVQAHAGWRIARLRLKTGLASVQLRGGRGLAWAYLPRGPVPPEPELIDELIAWARQ